MKFKHLLFALFIVCSTFMACEKDKSVSVDEKELIGKWVSLSGYPTSYTLDIKNVNGTPTPDIFKLDGNLLYWEPAPLQRHTFKITKLEGDIMVVDEGNNNDIQFKKINN